MTYELKTYIWVAHFGSIWEKLYSFMDTNYVVIIIYCKEWQFHIFLVHILHRNLARSGRSHCSNLWIDYKSHQQVSMYFQGWSVHCLESQIQSLNTQMKSLMECNRHQSTNTCQEETLRLPYQYSYCSFRPKSTRALHCTRQNLKNAL